MSPYSWHAPERAARVAALLPGRRIPPLTRETLYADWSRRQLERWLRDHPDFDPAAAVAQYAAAEPSDESLLADFPRHIAPFGRVRDGRPDPQAAANVLISYCPFCGSRALSLIYDPQNPYHATTNCCRTELWGREQDGPPDYPLRPTETVEFRHLDDTFVAVPCTVYRDRDGVVWELFLRTIFDQRRWLQLGCDRVVEYARRFDQTADPLYVHKIAVLLDVVADVYYGLPLCWQNEVALGADGRGLTRAEWEAVPRPAIFEVGPLGPWNRRTPIFNRGWINMSREDIWVEPFAQVRHHPSFKAYSQTRYGDPEALDQKITTRLLREISLMYQSVFSQKLLTNYQEANYVGMWLLGVLLDDPVLLDFAQPTTEVVLYNHTYQDGLNGEGAPNYMAMPGGYFYPYLADPNGWLRFYPNFLEDNPFYHAASNEMRKLTTVRGLALEFGDQHQHVYPANLQTDPAVVAANERRGSRNWAGYGVGILRVGGPGHRQEVGLTYTRASLHNAQDALSLECWFDGVPVMRRGGYAAWWSNAPLQWERPEVRALREMGYPHEIVEGERSFEGWSWIYAHSPLCQNGVTVEETGTGKGWGDNRGYGEVVTFKGGEQQGEPGSGFQVLDVRDHYSFARVGKAVTDFRRTLIGVEGPDGRPYVLDLVKLAGGRRHQLYTSAWAERAGERLPPTASRAEDLAAALFGGNLPEDTPDTRNYRQVRDIERLAPAADTWDLTWRTDLRAYAPRDANGRLVPPPWPEDVGTVRLRLFGLPADGTELWRGRGPWIGWLKQPLPNGQRVDGNVAFVDARDFLIESRHSDNDALVSRFVHVIEGYREGEESVIRSVSPVPVEPIEGPGRDVLALRIEAAGHSDTLIYQSDAGAVRLADGLTTDARYALLRRDGDGAVIGAEAVRGTYLRAEGFAATMPGDFTGTIVDVIGDLSGTRAESALVIRPDRPWPHGDDLRDRQLLVRFESALRDPCDEGWRIERVTPLPGELVRVDVQDHAPFATSWHQVTVLPADRPNVIRTNRPLVDHGNAPWYEGLRLWFPERDRLYTIRKTSPVGGGVGGDTVELEEGVDLAQDGIKVGDWFVIYGVEPGLRVTVANDFSWRREPAPEWNQHALRATGPVTVTTAATAGPLAWRAGDGPWTTVPAGKTAFAAEESAGRVVRLVSGVPDWLDLDDRAAPTIVSTDLDGQALTAEAAADLGWIAPPQTLTVTFRDDANPLDRTACAVRLDGEPIHDSPAGWVRMTEAEAGRALTITVDLARALAHDAARPRRHGLEVVVVDRSVERRMTELRLSFIGRVPLEEGVVWLSDLMPVRAFAHGGLIRDRDYVGNPAEIAGRFYPKCLTLCPEPHPDGAHSEAVYAIPPERAAGRFVAEVGISASAAGRGTATFAVQVADSADGPWREVFASPVLSGGAEPVAVDVPLAGAKFLRLYATDAGDGINSDHAVWGAARFR